MSSFISPITHTSTLPIHREVAQTPKWFQGASEAVGKTWCRLKEAFHRDTEETVFLRSQMEGDAVKDYERLASIVLKAPMYSKEGHLLRVLLKDFQQEDWESLLNAMALKNNEVPSYDKLLRLVTAESLTSAEREERLRELALSLPDALPPEKSIQREARKTFSVAIHFFPRFLDTVLKAFSLLEAGKGPETIWDFSAILEIYWKIFLIPHGVLTLLSIVISAPLQLYLATAAVVLGIAIGLGLYLKYRPCPTQLPRARNLTLEAEQGKLEPVIGRGRTQDQVAGYLGTRRDDIKTNLLIIGEPGVGKTELIKGVAQKYKEKRIFYLNGPELTSGFTPIGDKLRLLFLEIEGHENEVIFFIDEIGEAIKNNPSANFGGFLKPFLAQDGVQVIAAATSKEYDECLKLDPALISRFHRIDLEPATAKETKAILRERMRRKAASVLFADGIVNRVLEKTKGEIQPRGAVNLLDLAMNSVQAYPLDSYCSKELEGVRLRLINKRRRFEELADSNDPSLVERAGVIEKLEEKRVTLEEENRRQIELAKQTRSLIACKHRITHERNQLCKSKESDRRKLLFLHFHLLPWVEKRIQDCLEHLDKEIPMQVDEALLERLTV